MFSPTPIVPPGSGHQLNAPISTNLPFRSFTRIASVDVLRGIAVLFGVFVSIRIFGGFSTNQQNGLLLEHQSWNYALFATVSLLLEGKMSALISLVFGVSMVIFFSNDHWKNTLSKPDVFMRRQLCLILFGIINGLLLLWTGDILFHLGIMGILLFPFFRLSARGLMIAAIIATLIYSGKNYWNYADDRVAYQKYLAVLAVEKKNTGNQTNKTLSKQQNKDKAAWEAIAGSYTYDTKRDDAENKAMWTYSYSKLWNHLLPAFQAKESQWTYSIGVWDFASMILLGMALYKFDFFSCHFSKKQYLIIAAACLATGLLLGWFRLYHNQVAVNSYATYVTLHWMPYNLFFPFERMFMTLGYASLVLFLIEVGILKFLWRPLAAAGQITLTNYLMQSIICTLFFTGFGMGYFGRLTQYQLYFFAAEVCLVQIVFSIFWLKYYRLGPAEWLLRCIAYGKWHSNKPRQSTVSTPSIPVYS